MKFAERSRQTLRLLPRLSARAELTWDFAVPRVPSPGSKGESERANIRALRAIRINVDLTWT